MSHPARSWLPIMLKSMLPLLLACGNGGSTTAWTGTIDTLASGVVVVRNGEAGGWSSGEAWRLTETLRIGGAGAEEAAMFGRIASFTVDLAGRLHVLDDMDQQIRTFDANGRHVRTFGRRGGGPGELERALHLALGPNDEIWVADPGSGRIAIFDTDGNYRSSHAATAGILLWPWPGGFDGRGDYYIPVPAIRDGELSLELARHDSAMNVLDTVPVPRDPVTREFFVLGGSRGAVRAGIPFSGGYRWRLGPGGTVWGLLTESYELTVFSRRGDTLRVITREVPPVPVLDTDLDQARQDLRWFVEQGGQVDWSRIPRTRPPVTDLAFDEQGNPWVWRTAPAGAQTTLFDVFNPDGRYLGSVTSPVPIIASPPPVFRPGLLYAVTESVLGEQALVRVEVRRE